MKEDWEDRLKKDGPMYCKGESCVEFRQREPEFAQRLQDAGIIAHYNGITNFAWGPEEWMLSGITPIGRAGLERLISDHKK